MLQSPKKRLFFAFDIFAPWPEHLPEGKIIQENHRHMTLIFLGNMDFIKIEKHLKTMPLPDWRVGRVGFFDKCLFLPPENVSVTAWHMQWLEENDVIQKYHQELNNYLEENGFATHRKHDFLSHVSICREPQNIQKWKDTFIALPCYIQNLHLFESLGSSQYHSLWHHPLYPPFEQVQHTADIAFKIYAEDPSQIYMNAQTALFFTFPSMLSYKSSYQESENVEDIVQELNLMVSRMDAKEGAPIKAVSLHGEITKDKNNIYQWEMIIDV